MIKNIFVLFIICTIISFIPFSKCNAQYYMGNIDITTIDTPYIELVGWRRMLAPNQLKSHIDYGQKLKWGEGYIIKDKNGKPVIFFSLVGMLNFMYGLGWTYVDAYTECGQYGCTYHFLLRKGK